MNFTCLCFDLKYSFKINCCNLLTFSMCLSSIYQNLSWGWPTVLLIKARQTLDVTIYCAGAQWLIQQPPPATGINLRCCDLGTWAPAPQMSQHKLQDLIVLGWPGLVPPDAGSETSAQSRRQNWRPETYKGGIHFRWNSVDFVNK